MHEQSRQEALPLLEAAMAEISPCLQLRTALAICRDDEMRRKLISQLGAEDNPKGIVLAWLELVVSRLQAKSASDSIHMLQFGGVAEATEQIGLSHRYLRARERIRQARGKPTLAKIQEETLP